MKLAIDQVLLKADEALGAGEFQEADRLYTAILKIQPKHPDANHNMGVLAVNIGRFQEAERFFETALAADSSFEQFWRSYINLLALLNKFSKAKLVLNEAKNKGMSIEGFDMLSKRLSVMQKAALTKGKLISEGREQTSSIEGFSLDKALKLAKKKAKDGAISEARLIYMEILAKFPKNKRAMNGLKFLGSNKSVESFSTQDPSQEQIRLLIDLFKMGRSEEALSQSKLLLSSFPKSSVLFQVQGTILKSLGQIDLSIEAYKKAIDIRPDYADAYYNMGNALKAQGLLKQAIEAYNKTLIINPNYAEASNNLGITFQEQGLFLDAEKACERSIASRPNYSDAHFNLGNIFHEQGKLDAAIGAYNKAISIKPDYVDAYNNLGVALKEQGKLEEAIKSYDVALSIRPDYAEAYNGMGVVLKAQGKLQEAIKSYELAIRIKPDYAEAHNNMGNAFKEQGALESAINAYTKVLDIDHGLDEAIENFHSLLVQLWPSMSDFDYDRYDYQLNLKSEIDQRPKYQIQCAIKSYLKADFSSARAYINNFKACNQKLFSELAPIDKVFCTAYGNFIEKLLDSDWTEKLDKLDSIYHLGESHCLSYAHRNIKLDASYFKIAPRIVFGAKAFHFSVRKQNLFKSITKAHLDSLPKNSNVFLSFGEIDCRANEGFINASIKLEKSLESLIEQTATDYVKWFLENNIVKKHRLFFVNLPAPVYNERLGADLNLKVARAVSLFNSALKKFTSQHGCDMVDVFKFTVGQRGFSNSLFHVDNFHLGEKAVTEIERQLN